MLAAHEATNDVPAPLVPWPDELLDLAVMADDPCMAAFCAADPKQAFQYYRARYYDPRMGRFVSEDPIRFLGGENFYAYVENNPVAQVDPLGLMPGWTPQQMAGVQHVDLATWWRNYLDKVEAQSQADRARMDKIMQSHMNFVEAMEENPDLFRIAMVPMSTCRFPNLRDHALRHGNGLSRAAYLEEAIRHTRTGTPFMARYDGQFKWNYVTRTGPDSFQFTSTSLSGGTIFTHMEVNTQYLANKGITLPAGF